jgi:negative regulator of flagellin synthesis FlgM
MKINPSVTGLDQGTRASGTGTDRPANGTKAAGKGAAEADSIQLSALSAQLHALGTSDASGVEFDRAKVEAIKEAIREGRLTVDPEVVADRMLAMAMALMRKDG